LLRGFLAPFRGGGLIARHRLWHYLVLPLLLNLALGIAALFLAGRYWREEAFVGEQLIKAPAVGWLILVVLTIVSGVVLFLVAQPLLSAVFSDRLSERVERQLRGSAPTAPFFASTGRALAHGLLKLVLYALAMLMAFVLSLWTAGIGAIAGVALAGLFIAYDGFDYPLSRRGASFGKKWAYLATHPAQTIGFGAGATLLYLVPFALFVAPSFVAAGATALFVEGNPNEKVDKAEQKAEKKGEKRDGKGDGKGDGKRDGKGETVEGSETAKKPAGM
jgi:CysZ protein